MLLFMGIRLFVMEQKQEGRDDCMASVETELMRFVGRGSSLQMEDMEFWTVGDIMAGALE